MHDSSFDASSDPFPSRDSKSPASDADSSAESRPDVRPFVGIRFECCRTYGRIYRNPEKTAYTGNCPKCHAKVRIPIGSGGTSARFFNAN